MGGSKEEGEKGSAGDPEEPGLQNQGITSKQLLRRAVWWRSYQLKGLTMNHVTDTATGAKFTWLEDHNILLSLGGGHRRWIGYMELNTLQLKQMLGEKAVSCEAL